MPNEYKVRGIPLKLIQSPSRPKDGTFLFARKAPGQVQVDFASFTRRTPSLRLPPLPDFCLPRPEEMHGIIQQIQKKQNNSPLRFYSLFGPHQLGKSTIMLMVAHYLTRWYSRVVWLDFKDPRLDAANATIEAVEQFVLAKAHLNSFDDLADQSQQGVDKCIFFFDNLDKVGLNTQSVVHTALRLLQNKSVRVVAIRKQFVRLPNFVDHGNALAPLKERHAVKMLLNGAPSSVWKTYSEAKDPVFNGHCQEITCQADQGLPGLIIQRVQDLMRLETQTERAVKEQLALWVQHYRAPPAVPLLSPSASAAMPASHPTRHIRSVSDAVDAALASEPPPPPALIAAPTLEPISPLAVAMPAGAPSLVMVTLLYRSHRRARPKSRLWYAALCFAC